jgi:Ca2+-transporting ATPase
MLASVAMTESERAVWTGRLAELAAGGHKVVACAFRLLEGGWAGGEPDRDLSWMGLLACEDPVRPGVRKRWRVAGKRASGSSS